MNIKDVFANAADLNVETIMTDSRIASEKGIFFCIEGFSFDGHDFVEDAINNGAICIVHRKDLPEYHPEITYIRVDSVIKALNDFCAAFYGDVSRKMKVLGVTGTNGKSTIAYNLQSMINNFEKCGYIGTIGIVYDGFTYGSFNTTLGTHELHSTLKDMYDSGCSAVAMEVSSQGLDMHRVDSVDFDLAIFTNLSHEHLDYHGTLENYYHAKERFFTEVATEKTIGVINIDSPWGERLLKSARTRNVTYSIEKEADYQAANIREFADHSEFTLIIKGKERYQVYANVIAIYNVSNLLSCIAALIEMGYDKEKVIECVSHLPQVPGRCQVIDEGQPFTVVVDYANTPEGMVNLCSFAKKITAPDKRIILVIGSAGDRDQKKRPMMGAVADENCDIIIISSDDNHTEPFDQIANMIADGITKHNYLIIEDRYEAIKQAITLAGPGDSVFMVGKGDEEFFKNGPNGVKIYYMGDINVAHEILKELYGSSERKSI
ncbi:MAG: UDP-N-acetylmuramoyl-L-alanyl-D-glutamate--2,6-diaminopimelate ligase [Erysipelotrichaceae bacterium]|nr:UDP-N-acetylmuramoyl-L-alanyl-D-glutamate--2,6-diaminopimelate ligase [Erysipelotrichaceae bacterium]